MHCGSGRKIAFQQDAQGMPLAKAAAVTTGYIEMESSSNGLLDLLCILQISSHGMVDLRSGFSFTRDCMLLLFTLADFFFESAAGGCGSEQSSVDSVRNFFTSAISFSRAR